MMFGHDWEMGWVKNFLEPLRTVSQRGKETSQPCILRKQTIFFYFTFVIKPGNEGGDSSLPLLINTFLDVIPLKKSKKKASFFPQKEHVQ